ncbi:46524_t:CDS:2 [Gigaspora margarita]|uniref:46524_t:CDS:1 n=1 Tax=Gigaspora margarita TaxID=4874 RepID=A0ABN7UC52_GIGMA|nr:46524_t:CDS:2 [Gigaspora margarita]
MEIEAKLCLDIQNKADRSAKVKSQGGAEITLPEIIQQKEKNKVKDIQVNDKNIRIEQESMNLDGKTTYKKKEKATILKLRASRKKDKFNLEK